MNKRTKPKKPSNKYTGPIVAEINKYIESLDSIEIDLLVTTGTLEITLKDGHKATITLDDVIIEDLKTWNDCE